jgi:hypothetical protein
MDAAQLAMRAPDVLARKKGITLRTGVTVRAIDRAAQTVTLADGSALPYTGLVLATGSTARSLPLPGADAPNVLPLRTRDDASAMAASLATLREHCSLPVVVIGGGFIGLEVAATARKKGLAVTVLEAAPRLLGRVLAPALSDWYAALHRGHGVDIVLRCPRRGARTDGARPGDTPCAWPTASTQASASCAGRAARLARQGGKRRPAAAGWRRSGAARSAACAADVLGVERGHVGQRAGQETARHRAEGDEGHAQLAAGVQHGDLGVARPQRVLGLHRGDRVHRMRAAQRGGRHFAQADRADLALRAPGRPGAHAVLDRHLPCPSGAGSTGRSRRSAGAAGCPRRCGAACRGGRR